MRLAQMIYMTKPARSEIWLVRFDPQIGDEIEKNRPAVVVQEDGLGRLGLRIVVPITNWNDRYSHFPWHTKIDPTPQNGLSKTSSADSIQVKSVSEERFLKKLGEVSAAELENIVAAVALCVGYLP